MNLNDHSSPGKVGFLKYSYFTFCFPGIAKISVTVDLDANGIIHLKVACEEKEETLVIGNSNGRLDREEIDRIIKDAELCNDYISKENVPAEIPLPVRNYIRTACTWNLAIWTQLKLYLFGTRNTKRVCSMLLEAATFSRTVILLRVLVNKLRFLLINNYGYIHRRWTKPLCSFLIRKF